jgi:hypothetical protein
MPRKYAIGEIGGIAGHVQTHQDNEIIAPGEPLLAGAGTFDLTYDYEATPADVAAGAAEGTRLHITVQDIPTSASADEIRLAILRARADMRAEEEFGSDRQTFAFGDLV